MNPTQGQAAPAAPAMGSFVNVERNEGTVWLQPGIHTVVVASIAFVQPQTSSPYIGIKMVDGDGKETTQRFYVSPKAIDISLGNIVHLLNKIVTDEQLNTLQWPEGDYDAMCKVLDAAIPKDVAIEIKLSGEEYNGRINAKFAFKPFAQKPGEDRLIFNPDTDIKREEVADLTSNLTPPPAGGGAVPPPANGGPAAAPGVQAPGVAPGAAPAAPGIQVPQ